MKEPAEQPAPNGAGERRVPEEKTHGAGDTGPPEPKPRDDADERVLLVQHVPQPAESGVAPAAPLGLLVQALAAARGWLPIAAENATFAAGLGVSAAAFAMAVIDDPYVRPVAMLGAFLIGARLGQMVDSFSEE